MSTYQLRRYEMKPELFDDFLAWFTAGIPAIREQYGFAVERAYVDRAGSEFTWLVTHPGTDEEFTAAEAVYSASPESAAHGKIAPDAIIAMHVSSVEALL